MLKVVVTGERLEAFHAKYEVKGLEIATQFV